MKREKVVATIEARMGATRLPGKMALDLYPGLPALGAVIERLSLCRSLDSVIVATTGKAGDDAIVSIAERFGARSFRGDEDDVLGRVVGAGSTASPEALVLVTGDCSCISPRLIDEGIEFFLKESYDLVTNCLVPGFPVGIDLQVARFSSLAKAHDMAIREPYRRDKNNFEHTNFFMKSHPDIFRIFNYPVPARYNRPDIQLALDSKADLDVISAIYSRLYPRDKAFDIDDILGLLEKEPEILEPLRGVKLNRLGY